MRIAHDPNCDSIYLNTVTSIQHHIDAAKVLGSLAEVYLALSQKDKAVTILHTYYSEKYNRFSAFRSEVKAVVKGSDLLRNSGFLK